MTVLTEPYEAAGNVADDEFPAAATAPKPPPAEWLPAGAAVLRVTLLGRFTVHRGGAEVPLRAFGGRLARQLLQLLALRRGTLVPKDVIAEALWPRRPPADAAGNIEILVSRIRRALDDRTLIQTGPGGYTLAGGAGCWIDAEAFLAAVRAGRAALTGQPAAALTSFRTALGLWRGEPLAENAYAEWARQDRCHLSLAHLQALEGAATAALASGDPAEAADWAVQAVAREPLRETSVVLAVRALAATGDQAGALATFDEFRRRLADEAGLDPSPAAQQLRQHILLGHQQGHAAAARLAVLPRQPREVLSLLAMLGRPAPATLLASASGCELRAVLDVLEGLAHAGLARPGRRGWELTSQRPGRAVQDMLGAADKARLHALLAQALQQRGADPAETAGHLLACGDRDTAAAAYAAAAHRQLKQLRDEEAMRLAETGLSLDPPGRTRGLLLEARGEVHRRHGRLAEARSDLTSALQALDDAPGRSRLLSQLAILEARTASVARGGELAELAMAEAADRPDALGQALAAGAIIDLPAGNLPRAEHRFRRARQLLEQAGEPCGSTRVLYWQAIASFMTGRIREAIDQLGNLTRLPVTPPELLRVWDPRATRGQALAFAGQPGAGLDEIAATLEWAAGRGYPAIETECLWRRSEALAFLGRAGQAIESAQQAVAIATRIKHAACMAAALRGLGIAWEAAGAADRAEDAFRRSMRAAAGNPFFTAWAAARLGACLARQGRMRDAAPHVRTAMTCGTPLTRYEARWAHAELLAAGGDTRACRAAAAQALRAVTGGGYLILAPRLRELAGS